MPKIYPKKKTGRTAKRRAPNPPARNTGRLTRAVQRIATLDKHQENLQDLCLDLIDITQELLKSSGMEYDPKLEAHYNKIVGLEPSSKDSTIGAGA